MFSQRFIVRWSDLDANGHMRNTAYMEYSMQVRLAYFQARGFTIEMFNQLRFGPVIFREETVYLKELRLFDEFDVNYLLAGLSPDGAKFIIEQHIYRAHDGKESAYIRSEGAWLNLETRKLMQPPDALFQVFRTLEKTDSFVEIPPSSQK